nr:hypothetical protein B0A51_04817 [Rachicladosporium sp. CCFEE 5018]
MWIPRYWLPQPPSEVPGIWTATHDVISMAWFSPTMREARRGILQRRLFQAELDRIWHHWTRGMWLEGWQIEERGDGRVGATGGWAEFDADWEQRFEDEEGEVEGMGVAWAEREGVRDLAGEFLGDITDFNKYDQLAGSTQARDKTNTGEMPTGYYTQHLTKRKMAIPTSSRQRVARMSAPSWPKPLDPLLQRIADLPCELHQNILQHLTKDTQFAQRPYGAPRFLDHVQGHRLISSSNPSPPAVLQLDQCARTKMSNLYYNQTAFYVEDEETCTAWLRSLKPNHRHLISKICFLPSASACPCLGRTACMSDLDDCAARLARLVQRLKAEDLHPRSEDAVKIWVCNSLLSQQDWDDFGNEQGYWTSRHEVIFQHREQALIEQYRIGGARQPCCMTMANRGEYQHWPRNFACCDVHRARVDELGVFYGQLSSDQERKDLGMWGESVDEARARRRLRTSKREQTRRFEDEKTGKVDPVEVARVEAERINERKRKQREWDEEVGIA